MRFYSQHGEDFLLSEIFGNQKQGTFVEIGCIDGRRFSNTLMLEEQGWRGLCVEAHRDYIPLLYRNRPGSTIVHCAIGETDANDVPFFANARGSLSTLDQTRKEQFRQSYGQYFTGFEQQKVAMRTITTLLREYGLRSIDVLSLDIEGYEVPALQGLDLAAYRPRLLIIESDSEQQVRQFDSILVPAGYVRGFNVAQNWFYTTEPALLNRAIGRRWEFALTHTAHPLDQDGDSEFTTCIDLTGIRNLSEKDEAAVSMKLVAATPETAVADNGQLARFAADPDAPFLVSFPRTGSHWLRLVLEAYFDRPLLTRSFLQHAPEAEPLLMHSHDMDLGLSRRNAIYLYRDPVDTVFSQLRFHKEDPHDVARVRYWSDLYGQHVLKWLQHQDPAGKTTILNYEAMKQSAEQEIAKAIVHLGGDVDVPRLRSCLQQVDRSFVGEQTAHDTRVIDSRPDYATDREQFREVCADSVWHAFLQGRSRLASHFQRESVPSPSGYSPSRHPRQPWEYRKIVGLVPGKNEADKIEFCIRALAKICDAIVYFDDNSTDDSVSIVESIAEECRVERIVRKEDDRFHETIRRALPLEAGREIGGTHFIVIDADEAFTANCTEGHFLRQKILQLSPGDSLELAWIQLWRSVTAYRHDDSVWTDNYKAFVFADDGHCRYDETFIHLERVPSGLTGKRVRIEGYDYGLMHFQFVNWKNLLLKQAWYRCIERVNHPQKPADEINALYAPSKDERGIRLRDVPFKWFAAYPFFQAETLDTPDAWRRQEVLDWFTEYGTETFAELDIWDVEWGVDTGKNDAEREEITRFNAEGEQHFSEGRLEEARRCFRKALERDPENAELCNNFAACEWQRGNVAQALLLLAKGLRIAPHDRSLVLNGIQMLAACEQYRDARTLANSFLEDHPDDNAVRELLQQLPAAGQNTPVQESGVPTVGQKAATDGRKDMLVTAIVSAYNSEDHLAGCLEDLEAQTIASRLEIIVVDSGSRQNEQAVVERFQEQYSNIRYIRTEQRETIYAAWNRAIRVARGRYITNANTDDRHRRDALERLAAVLESHRDVALVYADSAVTKQSNASFESATREGYFRWPDFDANKLFEVCYVGPQPMWRRELHDRYGEFDASFEVAGDYEFWLRIATREAFRHIPEALGLYLTSEQGMERRHPQLCGEESERARARHWPVARGPRPAPSGNYFVPEPDAGRQVAHGVPADADAPLVSVIMPTKDRRGLITNAFASLCAQEYPNWELIVVNDGGEDISDLIDQTLSGRKVRYIPLPESSGQVRARNIALKAAHGDIICYLDDDDRFLPHHLSTVVASMRQEGCEFVYTDAEYITQAMVEGDCSEIARGNPYEHGRFSLEQLLVRNYIPINSWAHTRDCLWETGLFEESLPCLEDWELLIRIASSYGCHHIPVTTVEVYARADTQDNVSDRNRSLFLPTFLEIYKRHSDRGDPVVRARREEMLQSLSHEAVLAGVINGDPQDVLEAVLVELYETPAGEGQSATVTDQDRAEKGEHVHAAYQQWIGKNALQEVDLQILADRVAANVDNLPAIHLIAVVEPGHEHLLADSIDALRHQLYRGWGLSIVAATPAPDDSFARHEMLEWVHTQPEALLDTVNGIVRESDADWFAVIEAGDSLEPHALLSVAAYFQQHSAWHYVYCDEDRIDARGFRSQPDFKPDYNMDLLRSTAYTGGFCLVSRELLTQTNGFQGEAGIWNYEMALRATECLGEDAIGHIPGLLFHRHEINQARSQHPAMVEAAREALASHLERCKVPARVTDGITGGSFLVQYQHDESPLVSIIIPTKDRLDLIKPCVTSLLEKTTYPNFEVLVVDNNSSDPDVLCYLESLEAGAGRVNVLRYPHKYNFSAINNYAASHANGEYLLLLNNDTLVVQPNWLDRMVAHALRPEIGIVGARLVFPDQTLQHAGVVMGMKGAADHVHLGVPLEEDGYMGRAQLVQNFSAVTAACLLIRRSIYEAVEGLDEKNFKVLFNDVDLCLKVSEQGYKIVWTPYATVVHYGSSSLKEETDPKRRRENFHDTLAMFEKWLAKMAHDPAYNRNLTLVDRDPVPETAIVPRWNQDFHDRPRLLGFPFDVWGCGEYRVHAPLRALHNNALAQTTCVPPADVKRIPDIGELARLAPDSLLLQSFVHDYQILALEAYRKLLPDLFMVFELDDLKTDMPQKNPHARTMYRDIRKRLRKALGYCDRMIVSTESLADAYGKYVDDIVVVPNTIDITRWKDAVSQRQRGARPRVGWAGAQQHHGDLALLHEVVRELAGEVEWVFFGMCPKELRPWISEFHEGVKFEDYPAKLASMNLDLALAPLEHNKFNEAKSNLRLLEYGIMGWPVVATDIYPYQGAPVMRVANNPRAWIHAIREHVADPAASAQAGDRLRQWVLDNWLLERHLDAWLNALTPGSQIASAGDELRRTGTG